MPSTGSLPHQQLLSTSIPVVITLVPPGISLNMRRATQILPALAKIDIPAPTACRVPDRLPISALQLPEFNLHQPSRSQPAQLHWDRQFLRCEITFSIASRTPSSSRLFFPINVFNSFLLHQSMLIIYLSSLYYLL